MITITSIQKLPTRPKRARKSKTLSPLHLAMMDYVRPVTAVEACGAYAKTDNLPRVRAYSGALTEDSLGQIWLGPGPYTIEIGPFDITTDSAEALEQ